MIVFIWRTGQIFLLFWEVGDVPKKLAQGERFHSDEHTHTKKKQKKLIIAFVQWRLCTTPRWPHHNKRPKLFFPSSKKMEMISFSPEQNHVHFTVRLMIIGKQPRGAWKEETSLQIYMFGSHKKSQKISIAKKKKTVSWIRIQAWKGYYQSIFACQSC